jgi:hypothetical protein
MPSVRAVRMARSGRFYAGDMPNLHIPPSGALSVEVINAAITLDKDKFNSVFHKIGEKPKHKPSH